MNRIWIALILAIILTFSGCGASTQEGRKEQTDMQDLTQAELDLLCTAYSSAAQQALLRRGELSDNQWALIVQSRAGREWLERKYPSHSFAIVSIELRTVMKRSLSYGFTADGGDAIYYLTVQDEESRTFLENYYAALFRAPCEAAFLEQFRAEGLPVVALELSLPGLAGDGVTEATTPETLLAMDEIKCRCSVFLHGDESLLSSVRDAAARFGVNCDYSIFASERYMEAMNAEACRDAGRGQLDSIHTDSFRIGE